MSKGGEHRVYGYKCKKVRDNIHCEDATRFMLDDNKAKCVNF